MKPQFSISIPKPCHEDWSKMTPNEKGKFCKSCSKTVIDFTKMNPQEIQDYLAENQHQRICGHIKQSQLDTINLKIPEAIFSKDLNYSKVFLLALLLAMGMTLFNCEDDKGNRKKIESVEIIQSSKEMIDSTKQIILPKSNLNHQIKETSNKENDKTEELVEGLLITEIVGEIDTQIEDPIPIDSINTVEKPNCKTENKIQNIELTGDVAITSNHDTVFGLIQVQNPPEFKNTPQKLSRSEKRQLLSDSIAEFVKANFNQKITENIPLSGKQRINVQFKINEKGLVSDIKARAKHYLLEKEAIRVMKQLPQFKPAQQLGRNVAIVYALPIIFIIQD